MISRLSALNNSLSPVSGIFPALKPGVSFRPLALGALALFLTVSGLTPCSIPLHADSSSGVQYLKTELYFGPVDGDDWSDFLARDVTPRFPQGLTWLDVHGQWRDAHGLVRKLDSRLLILIYPQSNSANKSIEAIRSNFKIRFHQQSVLRVTQKVDASF